MDPQLVAIRNTPPSTRDHLWDWIKAYTGISVARTQVCRDHAPPLDWLAKQWLERPDQMLVLGSRGSGKSFLQAIETHLESRFHARHGTRILGGSKSQSLQIFEAITSAVVEAKGSGGSDRSTIARLLTDKAIYRNGSKVAILAASTTSVRGPHVATLKLDEVDEIDADLRESAMGMCMDQHGLRAHACLTSTWHKVGGPMAELVERGRSGDYPVYTTCTFDVLKRCDETRSGPFIGGADLYERCPSCPIVKWCHSERDRNGGLPLAKLSDGHYSIDSLAQKAKSVSARAFDSDYLCKGPRASGLWFTGFDESANVSIDAEYDPALPTHLTVDCGVFTGACLFQVATDHKSDVTVRVFGDYLTEGETAEGNARALLELARTLCGGRLDAVSADSSGGARNPIGPTVVAEYERVGLRGKFGIDCWPVGSVADSLSLLEGLIRPAEGPVRLRIHPRCKTLISSLQNYRRAKRAGQWQDYPEDPQHPHEDLVDALRGGLKVALPEGRKPAPNYTRRSLGKIRY